MHDPFAHDPRAREPEDLEGPEERLLEHMLERCLGEEQDSELPQQVVAAWQRGERGSLNPGELEEALGTASSTVTAPSTIAATGNGQGAPRSANPGTLQRPVPARALTPARRAAAIFLLVGGGAAWFAFSGGDFTPSETVLPETAGLQPPSFPVGQELPGPDPEPELLELPPPDPGRRRFDEYCAQLFAPAKRRFPWGVPGYGVRRPVMRELSKILRDEPRLWERFEGSLADMLIARSKRAPLIGMDPTLKERELRVRVVPLALNFLIQDPSEIALDLALELWGEFPQYFDHVHQIAFAERGVDDFQRECRDLVEIYDSEIDEPPYYPAAFLAFRGDATGRDVLSEVLTRDDPELLDARLLCALALDRLDDSNAWTWMEDRCRKTIEAYLENDVRGAVQAVLLFEHYVSVRQAGEASVAVIATELSDHLLQRSQEIGTEEDVRGLIATLF